MDDLVISRLLRAADLQRYVLDGHRRTSARNARASVRWADTCFKLFIDLSVSRFDATPTTGLAERVWSQQTGLKIDGGEQLSDLVAIQRPAPPRAQIPQPDRSDGGPDKPLDGMIDRREQAAHDVVAALV